MTLTPDQLDTLKTLVVGGGGGIIGSLCTEWLKTKMKLGVEAKHKKKEAEEKKIGDRLNPDLNVRRTYATVEAKYGMRSRDRTWMVNPFWVEASESAASLRGWPDHRVMERRTSKPDGRGDSTDSYPPITPAKVEGARKRREWLVLREYTVDGLLYDTTEPASADDSHLFQPLPEEKPRRLGWSRSPKALP